MSQITDERVEQAKRDAAFAVYKAIAVTIHNRAIITDSGTDWGQMMLLVAQAIGISDGEKQLPKLFT